MFVPGSAEFFNMNKRQIADHPEVTTFFERMTFLPLEHITAMVPPGGAGIGMHVIPVEKAIETENRSADIEHISHWLKKPDIFVGGDVCTGPRFAIDAIAAGKQGAISIHRFVQPNTSLTIGRNRRDFHELDKSNLALGEYDRAPRQSAALDAGIDARRSFRDAHLTLTEDQVKIETARCLGCGASVVDPNKCIGCGVCTTKCEFDANDPEVGLVHRIDKDTSGLLVVAKTPTAKTALGKQFFNKTTHRSYNALVWGNIVEDEGRIEGNIGRDPKNRLRMKVFDPDSGIGKTAVTHYKVLERFGYTTLVQCVLETGRTHQIRAHMKHIGHPLFMDETYGGTEILRGQRSSSYKAFIQNCFKLCPRQALHAKTLGFVHPTTKQQMDFDSEWPNDFRQLIEKWRGFIAGTTQDTFKNI